MFRYVLPLILLYSFIPEACIADEASWTRHVRSGQMALQRGRLERAEQQFNLALSDAEVLGERYPYLPISLNLLGEINRRQAKYQEALQYFERAVMLGEKSLGKDNAEFHKIIKNFVKLYRVQGLDSKAENLLGKYNID